MLLYTSRRTSQTMKKDVTQIIPCHVKSASIPSGDYQFQMRRRSSILILGFTSHPLGRANVKCPTALTLLLNKMGLWQMLPIIGAKNTSAPVPQRNKNQCWYKRAAEKEHLSSTDSSRLMNVVATTLKTVHIGQQTPYDETKDKNKTKKADSCQLRRHLGWTITTLTTNFNN